MGKENQDEESPVMKPRTGVTKGDYFEFVRQHLHLRLAEKFTDRHNRNAILRCNLALAGLGIRILGD
jgi:hypothetical protein